MTLVDFVLAKCTEVVQQQSCGLSREEIMSRVSDAVIAIPSIRDREVRLFMYKNMIQGHIIRKLPVMGLVECSTFSFSWTNNG